MGWSGYLWNFEKFIVSPKWLIYKGNSDQKYRDEKWNSPTAYAVGLAAKLLGGHRVLDDEYHRQRQEKA